MPGLVISKAIVDAMIVHARSLAPVEACGILSGRNNEVEAIHTMTNVDNSTEHFAMAPAEQFAVARKVREAGHETLAVYHSHPASPARPSEEDIRLALTPGVTYVILSLLSAKRPVVKGFRIEGREVTPVLILRRKSRVPPAEKEEAP